MRPERARGPGEGPTIAAHDKGANDGRIIGDGASEIKGEPAAAMGSAEYGYRSVYVLESIPEELRTLPQWVAWELGPPKKPGEKPRKIPINPRTGRRASTTDPQTWGTISEAIDCCKTHDLAGVGFVFTEDAGYVGVDMDNCRSAETGEIAPWAMGIVREVNSYTEVSQSETGIHIIVRGKLPPGRRKRGNVEMYDQGRFFTVTGHRLPGTPAAIEERSEGIARVHAQHLERVNANAGVSPEASPRRTRRPLQDASDEEHIEKAKAARNGAKFTALWNGDHSAYPSKSEADLALCGLLAFWTGGDVARIDRLFRSSGLMRDKWDQRRGETTYGERTIAKALDGRSQFYSPPSANGKLGGDGGSNREPQLTDTGNAERYVRLFKEKVRFCHPWSKWLYFDGSRWTVDKRGRILRRTKDVIRDLYRYAARANHPGVQTAISEWALKTQKVDRRKAMLELAKSEDGIPVLPDQLDRHPYLLNFKNGTLDLRTGVLKPHSREDYITRLIPQVYDPNAVCLRWNTFLERVLPDPHIRAFVKRAIGWSLTADVSEQVILFLYGEGANGKSTFLGTVQFIVGRDYAIQAAPDLLLRKRNQTHPTEVADLFGVRIAVCMEVGEERWFDEVLVKQLTGGDVIRARRMREDFWEFEPTHHLWIGGNHKPVIRGTDYAIWRRILLVPFTVTIPKEERDGDLPSKLRAEAAGILAWAVEGAQEWSQGGLKPPGAVCMATELYREEMDVLAPFLEERVVSAPGARLRATELYRDYVAWCQAQKEHPISQRAFGDRLLQKGFRRRKSSVWHYLDIALRDSESAFSASPRGVLGRLGQSGAECRLNGLVPPRDEFIPQKGPDCPNPPNRGSGNASDRGDRQSPPAIHPPLRDLAPSDPARPGDPYDGDDEWGVA